MDGTVGGATWADVAVLADYDVSDQVRVFFEGMDFILPNAAAVITGDTTGAAVEAGGVANGTAGTPIASGDLDAADTDNLPDIWDAVGTPTLSAHGYGTFTLTAAGVWTYTLDNTHADVEALNIGGTLTDTFTVNTVDTTAQTVTITIDGANDAPVAVADDNDGDVVKRAVGGPGDFLATGNVLLNDTDADAGDTKTVTAVNGSAANVGQQLVGIYGTLTLDRRRRVDL